MRAKADLIVVGSHGRRGVGRILLGSDAEQIVRHAPVPVLVVKATAESITLKGIFLTRKRAAQLQSSMMVSR